MFVNLMKMIWAVGQGLGIALMLVYGSRQLVEGQDVQG